MPSVRPDRINRPLRVVLRAPPSGHGATGGQAPRRVSAGDRRGDARRTPAGIRAEPQPDDEVTMNAFVKYLLTRGGLLLEHEPYANRWRAAFVVVSVRCGGVERDRVPCVQPLRVEAKGEH